MRHSHRKMAKYNSNESEDFPLQGGKKSIILDIRRSSGIMQGEPAACLASDAKSVASVLERMAERQFHIKVCSGMQPER